MTFQAGLSRPEVLAWILAYQFKDVFHARTLGFVALALEGPRHQVTAEAETT